MEKEIAPTKVCWLCRKNEASPNSSLEVSLTHKTIISAAGAQKEKQTIVSIPRCKHCEAIRKKRDNRYFAFTMVGLVVSVGACIYVDVISRGPGWLPWVVGGVLLVLIAFIPPIMCSLLHSVHIYLIRY